MALLSGTANVDAGLGRREDHEHRAKLLAASFECSPVLVAMLDSANMIVLVNPTFEQQMGPLFKLSREAFNHAAADEESNAALSAALDRARSASGGTVKARNVHMLTVAGREGFPMRKHFDWSLRQGPDGLLCAVGEMVTEADEEQREKDPELIAFFQEAPIAMHWLSSTGQIMWCNNTELRVLGYNAEEFIGQSMMKFCPDDKELVQEVFKQLGTGKNIKDVPVRFRSKDGRIVPLLIDSNANYTKAGEFKNTQCFIRDDTRQIVKEAQSEALMCEVVRTHKLFDVFVSRTLHLIRTPLHLLAAELEEMKLLASDVSDALENSASTQSLPATDKEKQALQRYEARRLSANSTSSARVGSPGPNPESLTLPVSVSIPESPRSKSQRSVPEIPLVSQREASVRQAELVAESSRLVSKIITMTKDFADSIRLEQGAELTVSHESTDLLALTKESVLLTTTLARPGVMVTLEFEEGFNSAYTDASVLRRVLRHLLENATQATFKGSVTLRVSHGNAETVSIAVLDTGKGLDPKDPNIFQRYSQPSMMSKIPSIKASLSSMTKSRKKLETDLSLSSGNEGIGIGLSLSYALVQALGGELRCSSEPGATCFFFDLPRKPEERGSPQSALSFRLDEEDADKVKAAQERESLRKAKSLSGIYDYKARPARQSRSPLSSNRVFVSPAAEGGIFEATREPLVLIVDDSALCVKVLETRLKRLGCKTDTAEDGLQAVEKLRSAEDGFYQLVLMDIRMPNMDGYEATRIAKEELKRKVPIVAVSAEDIVNTEMFDGFQPKPLSVGALTTLLSTFIVAAVA